MKTNKTILIITLLWAVSFPVMSQTGSSTENKVYAPFISRLTAEPRGTGILLTWKDAKNLKNPVYHIYESSSPINPEEFIYTNEIAAVTAGKEIYLYEPGDSEARFFLVIAEDAGKVFDLFIPYRNMTMNGVSAEKIVLQEEKAARISALQAVPDVQDILISARTTDSSRAAILFRSTEPMISRESLTEATPVRIFTGEVIEMKDHVVPGIPFYYAVVDRKLYESGSNSLLYDGSVTHVPVTIPLEEWSSESAHSFQYASRHIPLPLLNIKIDIESGRELPDPGLPTVKADLSPDSALALADLNLGKSVTSSAWRQPSLLPVDISGQALETVWVGELMEDGDWTALISRSEKQLKETFDSEIRSRLHFYNGQAHYFSGDLEYAFMEFLTSRNRYYKESNSWMVSIYEQRRILSRSLKLE